ncbi:hypothetical protein GWK47_055043 [Chionoecetes opilio]|uniref:Uncharacterized protein n=1 Tax=Chionoecetes opilio TaxID=41210 RepID=A0A8J4XXY0_CHIOP|nr:hypothetical protein GWK47_055043 [Chionoecetes opilio]
MNFHAANLGKSLSSSLQRIQTSWPVSGHVPQIPPTCSRSAGRRTGTSFPGYHHLPPYTGARVYSVGSIPLQAVIRQCFGAGGEDDTLKQVKWQDFTGMLSTNLGALGISPELLRSYRKYLPHVLPSPTQEVKKLGMSVLCETWRGGVKKSLLVRTLPFRCTLQTTGCVWKNLQTQPFVANPNNGGWMTMGGASLLSMVRGHSTSALSATSAVCGSCELPK